MQLPPLTPEEIEMNQAKYLAWVDKVLTETDSEKDEPDKDLID